jgi:hypothetical protein
MIALFPMCVVFACVPSGIMVVILSETYGESVTFPPLIVVGLDRSDVSSILGAGPYPQTCAPGLC